MKQPANELMHMSLGRLGISNFDLFDAYLKNLYRGPSLYENTEKKQEGAKQTRVTQKYPIRRNTRRSHVRSKPRKVPSYVPTRARTVDFSVTSRTI